MTCRGGGQGPEMVVIPAGRFQMGDVQGGGYKDEKPVHEVTLQKPFAMGKYEVTFEEYGLFATATGGTKPKDRGWGRKKRPVINVSWKDAKAYAQWLSEQIGKSYRLPSEAEWEYAARAGQKTKYPWGNKIGRNKANCDGCGSQWDNKQTAPVASFQANVFGLHDMSGNVWQWTEDCWHKTYQGAPENGTAWGKKDDGDCSGRVLRGGSWRDLPNFIRSASRYGDGTDYRNSSLGFRLSRTLK